MMQGESDRSIVKQPAMSYFYGSKPGGWAKPKKGKRWRPFGMIKQIADVLKDRKQSTKGAKELAYAIYRSLCRLPSHGHDGYGLRKRRRLCWRSRQHQAGRPPRESQHGCYEPSQYGGG